MRNISIILAAAAMVAFAPVSPPWSARADTILVEPDVDTWVMTQPQVEGTTVQEDVVVGAPLPETVKIMTVPKHEKYGFAVINKKRVIVDAGTRKVIKIY